MTFAAACFIRNCLFSNTSGTAGRDAVALTSANNTFFDCEFTSTNGYCADVGGNNKFLGCYFHDSSYGVDFSGNYGEVTFCIFDTITNGGINVTSGMNYQLLALNNVFYNCGTGIYYGVLWHTSFILNNIFKDNTTGVNAAGGSTNSVILDYNNFHGNSTDVTNVTKGPNTSSNDPQFTDAAGGDFSLQSGSPCIGAGFATRLGVG